MSKTTIISFTGKQGAGKDAACLHLQKWALLNNAALGTVKFAGPLQDLTAMLLEEYKPDLSHRDLFLDREWKETKVYKLGNQEYTPRKVMQLLGTEGIRNTFNDQVWCGKLFNEIKRVRATDPTKDYIFTVSDLRFLGEFDYLKEMVDLYDIEGYKYVSIYIDTFTTPRTDEPRTTIPNTLGGWWRLLRGKYYPKVHASELDLPKIRELCDYVVPNHYNDTFFKDIQTIAAYITK